MSDDPFVIEIPQGARTLDLRPLLEPIIRRLMLRDGDQPGGRFSQERVDGYAEEMAYATVTDNLVSTLRWKWISDYMIEEGWRRSGLGGGAAQYYPPERRQYGPTGICVCLKEEHIPAKLNQVHQNWKALREIARWELSEHSISDQQVVELATKILASVDVVTRLGEVAAPSGRVSADP